MRFELQMFIDRRDAGRQLAQALRHHAGSRPVVLGLPRGGVPVADEVARALGGTLDVWVARKLGAPGQPEFGMGAVAEGPALVVDRQVAAVLGVGTPVLRAIARREMAEVRRRVAHYRRGRDRPDLRGRTVLVVDDGVATGGTMRAAIRAIRKRGPGRLVVAVPVGAADTVASLRRAADEVVCLLEPPDFHAVGLSYRDFRQLTDDDVTELLFAAPSPDLDRAPGTTPAAPRPAPHEPRRE